MKKSIFNFVIVVTLILTAFIPFTQIVKASELIQIEIDGIIQKFEQQPIIEDGTTLVSLRELSDALEADVIWDNQEYSVTVMKTKKKIYFKLGDPSAYIDGKETKLTVPAKLVKNKTFVPVRFITEALGAIVKWDNTNRTVKIMTTDNPLYVSLVTDVGGINDQSFNQLAWEGLKKAEDDLLVSVSYKESFQYDDYLSNINLLENENNDLIIGIGFTMGDVILTTAQNNLEQNFAIIDYAYNETPENLTGIVFKEEEGSFLAGYIAGKMTKTGKVGFVGGMKVPVVDRFYYGFHAGVKYANPDVIVANEYANSFTDSTKGKEIANNMYQEGADILFQAAGGVGNGVIEAAKEVDKYVIGVDFDQNFLAPENVITSVVKRIDNAVYYITKQVKEGHFIGGKTLSLGLAEGGVDIAQSSNKHVPQEILDEILNVKQLIIEGEIFVPYNDETFTNFEVK